MSPQDFCYWLQGFLEMGNPKEMNEGQVKMLKNHLGLVFVNVTSDLPQESSPEEPKKEILTDAAADVRSRVERVMKDADFWKDRDTLSYCTGFGVKLC